MNLRDGKIKLSGLTPSQLCELRAGDPLTFPPSESCPMAIGDVIVIESVSGIAFTEREIASGIGSDVPASKAPSLWIEVHEIRRTRKMQWRVLYRRFDFRPLWLKGGPPKPEGSRLRQRTWTEIEEHGLTDRPSNALDSEAEITPGGYGIVIEMGARLKAAERREGDEEAARQQARSMAESIKQIVTAAARAGVDPTPHLAQIQRALEAAQAEIDEAA